MRFFPCSKLSTSRHINIPFCCRNGERPGNEIPAAPEDPWRDRAQIGLRLAVPGGKIALIKEKLRYWNQEVEPGELCIVTKYQPE
jgi:hypothetical protein